MATDKAANLKERFKAFSIPRQQDFTDLTGYCFLAQELIDAACKEKSGMIVADGDTAGRVMVNCAAPLSLTPTHLLTLQVGKGFASGTTLALKLGAGVQADKSGLALKLKLTGMLVTDKDSGAVSVNVAPPLTNTTKLAVVTGRGLTAAENAPISVQATQGVVFDSDALSLKVNPDYFVLTEEGLRLRDDGY